MVTSLDTLPPEKVCVVLPYDEVVPHSNHPVVAAPLGLTVPLRVADVELTDVAALVVTVGFMVAGADVVKDISSPYLVPALFWPTARKW